MYWHDFPAPGGSETGYPRPVVIVQNDRLNETRLRTTVVVPLTSNLRASQINGNVLLRARETNLPQDSVALAIQITNVDKRDLRDLVGSVSARQLRAIVEGVILVLESAPR